MDRLDSIVNFLDVGYMFMLIRYILALVFTVRYEISICVVQAVGWGGGVLQSMNLVGSDLSILKVKVWT